MELGGNKKAHTYYTKNNMYTDGRPNHENPALAKYKMNLAKQALEALGVEVKTAKAPAPAPKITETPKEEETKQDPFFENISKPVASKVDNATSSSVYSFTNLKQGNQQVNLNAKKLDVDFGGDDFFDSFGMGEQTKTNDNPFSVADEPKQEEVSGPFQLGSGVSAKTSATSDNDEFVKQKLKQLEGKKAISSEDFKNPVDDEVKENLKKFSGAKAISSDQFFGEKNQEDNTNSQDRNSLGSFGRDSFGDKVSEAAIYAADAVAQNAKKLREKAGNFFAAFGRPSE